MQGQSFLIIDVLLISQIIKGQAVSGEYRRFLVRLVNLDSALFCYERDYMGVLVNLPNYKVLNLLVIYYIL